MVRCNTGQDGANVRVMTSVAPHIPAPPASLSALDGWIDICRAGSFTASTGPVTLAEADLDEMVANFERADPAPVVLGHPTRDDVPAEGWVDRLRRVGDRLQARLTRLDDDFRSACQAGRFAARSIGATKEAAGWTLQHLAFLGAALPAVDGLAPSHFSRHPKGMVIALSAPLDTALAAPLGGAEERLGWWAVESMLRSLREWVIERSTIATADRVMPAWSLDTLRELAEPEDMVALVSRLHATLATGPDPGTSPGPDPCPDPGTSPGGAPAPHFTSRRAPAAPITTETPMPSIFPPPLRPQVCSRPPRPRPPRTPPRAGNWRRRSPN